MAARLPLRVQVDLDQAHYDEDLESQAQVDPSLPGLNRALAEHPGRFAWWATLESLARAQVETLAQTLRYFEGAETERLLQSARAAGARPPAANQLKGQLLSLPRHRELTSQLARARQDYRRVQIGRKTIQEKKDMVLALAANLRAELEGRLTLKGQVEDATVRLKQFYSTPHHPTPRRT